MAYGWYRAQFRRKLMSEFGNFLALVGVLRATAFVPEQPERDVVAYPERQVDECR